MVRKKYEVEADFVKVLVSIEKKPEEHVASYLISYPEIKPATAAVLDSIRDRLITEIGVEPSEIIDIKAIESVKQKFLQKALELVGFEMPKLTKAQQADLAGRLIHQMLGLDKVELLLADDKLEEIVINSSREPIWVYHKEFGWLKTNIRLKSEEDIYRYASMIGRRVGRQITNLNPLMDAHLVTGDRVNSTLFPITTQGNTLTIRKFARSPWTITHFIELKTINFEVASLLWLAIQYELSMIIAGGTASGKTSLLNVLAPFIQPTHRIVSIEDTRELNLPKFLHWVPMTTREPNPEGKGGVSMLDLMINSLRMRPDRIIVGEIRRQRQAEVLFEAMHTGHSVYSTLHANTADEVKRRMVNPPISIPESMLEALDLTCVQYRDRRTGRRRVYQVAEFVAEERAEKFTVTPRILYQWDPRKDRMVKIRESTSVMDEIRMHTGMSDREIKEDMTDKENILRWLVNNRINTVNTVGKIIADYYRNSQEVLEIVRKKKKPKDVFEKKLLAELKRSS